MPGDHVEIPFGVFKEVNGGDKVIAMGEGIRRD